MLIEQNIRRLRGTTLPHDDVTAYLRTYVRHEDDDLAISKILDQWPVVVLTGADGSGRFSTALDVLRRQVGDTIRQVRREPDTPFDTAGLHETDTGWILDLRAESAPGGFGRELAEDATQLPQGSCLVVLMGPAEWATCRTGAEHLGHALTGPPRTDILKKQLAQASLTIGSDRWAAADPIQQAVAALLPAQVAAWADAIVTTEEVERAEGRLTPALLKDDAYFAGLVRSVVNAAEDWRSDLLDWHTRHSDSAYRNYLLAAAVLEGASSEKIYAASTTLAKALEETPQERPGQQGLGVVALTHTANADLQPDGTIRFRYHNYAEAVVDYFLDDRPHLLKKFTAWTAKQVTGLEEELATPLAQRVSHWVVHYTARHRRTRLLRSLAEQWSADHAEAACELLVLAAVNERAGDLARSAYRRWTRQEAGTLTADFTIVLIRACQRLAEVYPTSMLSRLAELAAPTHHGAHGEDVATAISQALNALWDQNDQRSAIHRQLTQWTRDAHRPHQAAAQSTFAHLAARRTPNGPALLTTPQSDTDWLTDMWRNALPTTGWSTTVAHTFAYWMQCALDHPELQATIEQIFRNAVHRDTDPHYSASRLVAMQSLLFSWAPAPPSQQPGDAVHLRDHLLTGLRAADPAAPPATDAPQP
ncbi:hypothetical protein [Streptomyces sp. NPDC048436]|uniref:hypothetical protein n=1 Tax=Streptomyces sp. NPDC048436 TaxID=3365550 RepID=UPI003722967D